MEIHRDCFWAKNKNYAPKVKTRNIKECLNPEGVSKFQALMTEIRNYIIIKSNENKEIGKPRYRVPNLPAGLDPVFTTFGTLPRDPCSLADVIHGEYVNYIDPDIKISQPGERTTRGYSKPFNQYGTFGKFYNLDTNGFKAKKLLYWYKGPQDNQHLNDQPKKFEVTKILDDSSTAVHETLREIPINAKIKEMKKCLAHINSIRQLVKKRDYDISFYELKDHFDCITKNKKTVKSNEFYQVLRKVKILLDRKLFEMLLEELNLIKDDFIRYDEALDVLNWRYEFPTISKINDIPKELQCYSTTYRDTILNKVKL